MIRTFRFLILLACVLGTELPLKAATCGEKSYDPKTQACCDDGQGKLQVTAGVTQVIADVSLSYSAFCSEGCVGYLTNHGGAYFQILAVCKPGQNPIFTFDKSVCPGTQATFSSMAGGGWCMVASAEFRPTAIRTLMRNSTDRNCKDFPSSDCACRDGICTFPVHFSDSQKTGSESKK